MKPSTADLKSLVVFVSVVDHLGFRGAQAELNLSQSAISFHIKALEERVGFTLCQRGRQGFELTDRGHRVYRQARALLASVEDFDSEMGELKSTVYGTLRIGIVDNTVMDTDLDLKSVVGRFLQKYRQVRLDIDVAGPDRLMNDVASGVMQVALLPESPKRDDIQQRRVYTEHHGVYCGKRHPLFSRPEKEISVGEIVEHAFVVRPYANLRELAPFPGASVGAHASNMEAQALLILSGHFLGNLPIHYAQYWTARGELRQLMPDQVVIESPFHLVSRVGRKPSLLTRAFIQEFVAHMAAQRERLDAPRPGK